MLKNIQIEKSLYYDYEYAQILFKENFKHMEDDYFIYTNWEQLKEDLDIDNYITLKDSKPNRVNLLKYIKENDYNFIYSDFKYSTNQELFIYIKDYIIQSNNIRDINYFLENYIILDFDYNYSEMKIASYNDYCIILTNKKEYKELTGSEFDENKHYEYFSNLVSDAPISFNINISFDIEFNNKFHGNFTKTYNLNIDNEFLKNEYDYYNLIDTELLKKYINRVTYNNLTEDEVKELINNIIDIDYDDIKHPY